MSKNLNVVAAGCLLSIASSASNATDLTTEKRKKHTISLGYVYTDVSGSVADKYKSFKTGTASEVFDSLNWQDGGSLKYRYEYTESWGVIVSSTGSSRKVRQNGARKELTYGSLLAGPTYRFNDYFSTYAQLGVAGGEYKQKSGNNSLNKSARALGAGVGVQINPISSLSIDLGYEFSRIGFGDNIKGNYNSWIVSAGYRF